MVGHQVLVLGIGVRVPVGQHKSNINLVSKSDTIKIYDTTLLTHRTYFFS